jgi:hypothetical protein
VNRAAVSNNRWSHAFGPSVIAAARVLAAARQAPGDWRTILEELGLVEQVVKHAVGELLQHNEGRVITLSPLAADVAELLPDERWSRKQIAKMAIMWLGLSWRRDLVYDRPLTGLAQTASIAA